MSWRTRFKPGAGVETHLLFAALMWSFIGIYLMVRGWLLQQPGSWFVLIFSLVLGAIKAFFLIERAARSNLERISARPDGMCLGGIYSWGMWGLVVAMMLGGRFLRDSPVPSLVVGVIYLAVGWALFWASRILWRGWWNRRFPR